FVLGKTIDAITVQWPKIIKHPDDIIHFEQLLVGETIRKMGRHGKFLLFYFDDVVLVSHLRMEGKYRVVDKNEPMDKHTHVIFHSVQNYGTTMYVNSARCTYFQLEQN